MTLIEQSVHRNACIHDAGNLNMMYLYTAFNVCDKPLWGIYLVHACTMPKPRQAVVLFVLCFSTVHLTSIIVATVDIAKIVHH